jgi:hypothetical protein
MGILFFFWFLFSIMVGAMGSDKTIGFGGAFFFSLIFSPLIGLIIVLCSANKKSEAAPFTVITKEAPTQELSIASELEKFKTLLDNGAITQDEYDEQKKRLLSN